MSQPPTNRAQAAAPQRGASESVDDAVRPEGEHTQEYQLRHDELGPGGYYPPSVLLGVLQQAAIDGSGHRGFPMSYYDREQAFWMLRRITFRYERPLRHGDSLQVRTWVSRVGKTSPTREYRIDSASRGECIARVRTYWVYMDLATERSKEIPADLREGFAPTGEPLESILDVPSGALDLSVATKTETRTARHSDVDWSGHVKCCRYVTWLEDLLGRACADVGDPSGATSVASFDLQLMAATQAGDQVRVLAQPGATWKVDLSTADGQVVARAALWPRAVNRARTEFRDLPAGLCDRLLAQP